VITRISGTRPAAAAAVPIAIIAVLAFAAVPHQLAYSQGVNRTVEFEDLGFTEPIIVGARPAAMAGAYVASGNDVHMLLYNPAGLARVKRIELSLGANQNRSTVDNILFGNSNSIDFRDSGLDGAALAWPLPTYRGNLTIAFGVYHNYSSVLDLHYRGTHQVTNTGDNYLLQQTGSVYSYNLGFGVDLAPVLSGGLTFFLLDGTFDRLTQSDFTFLDPGPVRSVFVKEDVTGDVTGVGGRIGVQLQIRNMLIAGINFTPPVWARLQGGGTYERTDIYQVPPDDFVQSEESIDDDYLLPFRIDVGAALRYSRLLVEFDFGYSDWTEAAIDRKRFRNPESLEPTFREVFEYKMGAEYTFYRLPIRVRAGYAYLPYPLAYVQTDRIENNSETLTKATVEKERQQITVGLGGLIGEVLTIDASLSYTSGKRSTTPMVDERSAYRFVLTASYRI
jgi:hypothetical protein